MPAGGLMVREQGADFPFGLGAADALILHDPNGQIADQLSWTSHVSSAGPLPRRQRRLRGAVPLAGRAQRLPLGGVPI